MPNATTSFFDDSALDTISKILDSQIEITAQELLVESALAAKGLATARRTTVFHAVRAPSISVRSYLQRIMKYTNCSTDQLVLSLIYIDKLTQQSHNHVITDLTVHRLLITAVVLASKFASDFFYSNKFYAKIGGVTLKELNALEREFLYLLDFSLSITDEEFESYRKVILRPARLTVARSPRSPGQQPLKRHRPTHDARPRRGQTPPKDWCMQHMAYCQQACIASGKAYADPQAALSYDVTSAVDRSITCL